MSIQQDYILRLTESVVRFYAGLLFPDKKLDEIEIKLLENIGELGLMQIILSRMIAAGQFNEAENFLFAEIEKNPRSEHYSIAEVFYAELSKKTDRELEHGNFSREEIEQGLKDLECYFSGIRNE